MKVVLKILVICITFSSCTKFGKNVTVKGRVVNPITGQGIEGAEIWLQRGTADLPGGTKTVKKATTDAHGNYEINKLGLSHYKAICVIGDRYALGWTQDEGVSYVNPYLAVKRGKTMHVDFHAVEYGCLQYHVENQNCEGATDSMIYRMKYQFDDDFLSFWSFPTIGCFNTLFSGCTKVPMGNHIFEIKVYRPSGVTHFFDTVFVSGSGTTLYHQVY